MKRLFLALLLLFPAMLFAQSTQDRTDPKYLSGAFSLNNGKMYVERKLDVAELNATQIKEVIAAWLKERYAGQKDMVIEPSDASLSYIVQSSDQIRVKIGLFGSNVNFVYNLLITYANSQCTFQFRGMRFSNNPFSKNPAEFVTAEEYLTEKNSLTKDKTKVSAGIGTYRMGVIDKIDEITREAQKFIDISFKNFVRNNEVAAPYVASAASSTVAATAVAANAVKDASVNAARATANAASSAAKNTADAAKTAASTVKGASVNAAAATASTAGTVASKVSSEAKKATEDVKAAVAQKPAEKVENTIVSEECVKLIKAGGAAITAVGGKKLGKPVFGNAKYTKFGGSEVIMYRNAGNEDNINLLLDMAETFEVSVYNGSNRIATFKCKKAESLDDSVMGEVVSKL